MGKIDDDPVYNQPKPTQPAGHSQSTANDPYYNQSKPSSEAPEVADDPVYGQAKRIAAGDNDADYSPSTSHQTPIQQDQDGRGKVVEDPTYNQPQLPSMSKSKSGSQSIADDPTYNQPKRVLAGAEDSDYSPASSQQTPLQHDQGGRGEVTEDPTYNQPKLPSFQKSDNSGRSIADDPTYNQPKTTKAAERLVQLNNQIAPTPSESDVSSNMSKPRKSRKKPQDYQSQLPADYTDIMTNISDMQSHARNPPADHRGYTRQKAAGKMTSRDRIATLTNLGTFREIGSVTGSTKWTIDPENPLSEKVEDFIPSNNPQGFAQVTCLKTGSQKMTRQIYLTSDDFSIRGGHADGHNGLKTVYGEKLALRLKVPVVKLVDGSSGGGSVTTIATTGYSYLPHVTLLKTVVKQLNQGIPNLGAVVGPAIGLGAARVVSTHFSVMAADIGSLFNAGPKVVEGATFEEGLTFQDLGGPYVHCCNGTIDNMAANEKECYEQMRTVLGFLPDCGALQAPPVLPPSWSGDDVNREDLSLRSIIPRKKNRMYNPYTIIESVVDKLSWFEIGRLWGRTAIVGLARLAGRPVAILSNNCEVNGGALDAAGSQKMMKHIKFADIFNLPIVQFVDVRKLFRAVDILHATDVDTAGYAIGTVAERTGVMKWGVELGKAYYTSTTPIFTVLTRRAYGVAGGIQLDSREPWMRIAWPSANWGSLPLDGGIEVGHRHELKTIREQAEKENPGSGEEAFKNRYKELDEMYTRLMNPVRTANVFNVEEMVDPKDTRKICCRWVKEMYGICMQERLADRASGRIVPVFS